MNAASFAKNFVHLKKEKSPFQTKIVELKEFFKLKWPNLKQMLETIKGGPNFKSGMTPSEQSTNLRRFN